jgi:hypothetical protein
MNASVQWMDMNLCITLLFIYLEISLYKTFTRENLSYQWNLSSISLESIINNLLFFIFEWWITQFIVFANLWSLNRHHFVVETLIYVLHFFFHCTDKLSRFGFSRTKSCCRMWSTDAIIFFLASLKLFVVYSVWVSCDAFSIILCNFIVVGERNNELSWHCLISVSTHTFLSPSVLIVVEFA